MDELGRTDLKVNLSDGSVECPEGEVLQTKPPFVYSTLKLVDPQYREVIREWMTD